MRPRHLCSCSLPLTLAFLMGCSTPVEKGKVTGSVVLAGKPLAGATVNFEDTTNINAFAAKTDAEGNFEAESQLVKPGKYRVLISKFVDPEGKEISEEDREQFKAAGLLTNAVPQRYSDPATTDLKADIQTLPATLPPFKLEE